MKTSIVYIGKQGFIVNGFKGVRLVKQQVVFFKDIVWC